MIKIYHHNRCRKSRAGLDYLNQKTKDFEIIDYLNHPLSETELADLIKLTGKKPFELVRTQEELYKKKYKGKSIVDAEWIKILAANPKLIQRPIVVIGNKAVLAQPPDELDKIL
jgi:arsenate reductase (glutaredoxin)